MLEKCLNENYRNCYLYLGHMNGAHPPQPIDAQYGTMLSLPAVPTHEPTPTQVKFIFSYQ